MISAPRLLAAPGPGLSDHLRCFGELPHPTAELIATVEQSGLSGRGGGGFPTGRKMAAITGSTPIVVGNGAEGEPLSRKDAELLNRAPHLVLDGLDAAAAAIGADRVYLYVHPEASASVAVALDERRTAGLDPRRVTVVEAPDRFVAGEESAAIRHIEGGPALPRDRTVVSAVSGVRGRPTLVNNVETLAHIALIARYGSDWFRSVGDPHEPGTMLVTLSGALEQGIVEIPTGLPLSDLLEWAGADPRTLRAALIGGYHGTWLAAAEFGVARLSRSALTPLGATPGAGIVHALDSTECGLSRTAEIAGYLADQSARQCGPCLNGLPRLASLLDELAFGRASDDLVREIRRMVRLVDGRGSCRHPDGTARMVRSALHTFADEVDLHSRRRCAAAEPEPAR
jgi:NADH:ubiquinone oxidoreductase subunit F (NADH-binding)